MEKILLSLYEIIVKKRVMKEYKNSRYHPHNFKFNVGIEYDL